MTGTITIQFTPPTLTGNLNFNSPQKWTQAPWLEGTQSAIPARVTLAGHSVSEQTQDLVTTVSIAEKAGPFEPFEAAWRWERIALWHPICSKFILLAIDAWTGSRTFRAGVGRSLPRMQTRMATIAQWARRLVSQTV
jgi:hypothetical protein